MIPAAKPLIGEEEAMAAAEVIKSGMLVQGKKVAEFEEQAVGREKKRGGGKQVAEQRVALVLAELEFELLVLMG